MAGAASAGSVWKTLAQRIFESIFPYLCLVCDAAPATQPFGLCLHCRSQLRQPPDGACTTCGTPLPGASGSRRCGTCLRHPRSFDRLFFLYPYLPPADAVVRAFKFKKYRWLGTNLANLAFDRFAERLIECDCLVPIPMHWTRLAARGFNQSEVLASTLAAKLHLPSLSALSRAAGKPQSLLPLVDRRRHARRLLRIRSRVSVAGRRVLLVDDVTTSGQTLEVAASLLRRAGAESVCAFVVARTPSPSE